MTKPTPEQIAAAGKIIHAALDPAGYWEERCAKAEAERDRLARQVEAVRAMHYPVATYSHGIFENRCNEDRFLWPCTTALVLATEGPEL